MSIDGASQAVRCAQWARSQRMAPIGTAGSFAGVLVVEADGPWPANVADIPWLSHLRPALADTGTRLQTILTPRRTTGHHVILYQSVQSRSGFSAYAGVECVVDKTDVAEAALALLQGGTAEPTLSIDVLVCTHGRRDACCGSAGTVLALEAMAATELEGVRLWRTSHLGGHRFAPTALVLPAGTSWAGLDLPSLARVARDKPSPEDVVARYRGCTGLASPALQALEQAVLLRVGPDLLRCARLGRERDGRVELDVVGPQSAGQTWSGTPVAGRLLPIPDCGAPIEAATSSQLEIAVTDLRVAALVPTGPQPLGSA